MASETTPRGYPFPECQPPLTEDAADIAQLRDFAMAVDADVEALAQTAINNIARPPGVEVRRTTPAAFSTDANITFETVPVDIPGNQGFIQGLAVRTPGTYLVTAHYWCATTGGTTGQRLNLFVDGVQVHTEGVAQGFASASPAGLCGISASTTLSLQAEQRIRMRAEQGTATQLTINQARMAFVRLGDA